jgi:zinc carboxypeptidase
VRTVSRLTIAIVAAVLATTPAVAQQVPSPDSHFGFRPGTDRKLADWTELTGYYAALAEASPRVVVDTIGPTTMGAPFVMLTVTSEQNQARLDELQAIQLKLADPRTVSGPEELSQLIEFGKTVVLITHAIHATEVGGAQTAANLLYRLASSDDPKVQEILDNVILLDIPSLNPDGTEWVVDWYNQWVGTEFEASPMPWLYHPYVGHDNNRDWYAFTQKETQNAVLGAHNKWHPQIVHDIHQMGGNGARIFFPPYIDPIEHNVDPGITTAVNQLGSYMAAELTAQGKKGVVIDAIYDGFTPARAYQHYHAGARILSETASARLATPVELSPEQVRGGRGYDAAVASANFPFPWEGGTWGLPDIVDYMEAGAMALLTNAAKNREFWLENFYRINERAVNGWGDWPAAWVIPADQDNASGLAYVLRILRTADVEVHRATRDLMADGRQVAAGAYVIPMNQPYASFAQTMLEVQDYPDLREYPGGPPRRPYDVTAHTLGLLMDVEAYPVDFVDGDLMSALEVEPIERPDFAFELPAALRGSGAPRVGLYKSWQEPMEAGWTRWVFDQHGLQYDTVKDARIQRGNLAEDFDVILLQDQSQSSLLDGYSEGQVPADFTGGIGGEGSAALEAFVRGGGRIVAIEEATEFVVDLLGLGVTNEVERLQSQDFYVPGSILEVELAPDNALNAGMDDRTPVWFWRSSRAFGVDHPGARVVARYAEGDPLMSGWILGPEHLAGKPAIVEIPVGKGSVVLFGFQPNYRAQTVATWPLLFNALNTKVIF